MRKALFPSGLLRRTVFAAGLALASFGTQADDVDIYTNPNLLPLQAPITALALDLNLTNSTSVVCDNVLLSTDQNCVQVRATVTVEQLLSTLGLPLTILGGLNPTALLRDLNSGVLTLLSSLSISAGATLSLTQQQVYVLGLQQILQALVDSRVTILLNHNNRGPLSGSTVTACAFADKASMPAARQDTLACSNGAYLFSGLVNLADPVQLQALLTKMIAALLPRPSIDPSNPTALPTIAPVFSSNHPYQAKEIYAELAKYLRGDPIFNGHLGYFDYGNTNPSRNLNASFPLLSWDTSAEQPGGTTYRSGLAAFPQACSINLVHLQLTNAQQQDDSDADLMALFPAGDADGNGQLTLPELVDAAATDGFRFGAKDRRFINSSFIVQDNLFSEGDLSDLDKVGNLGSNINSYSNVLGLLGRGQDIASALMKTLAVDTTLGSISTAASRTSNNGTTDAAYLPLFRAEKNQKPAWYGNVKRLKLREVSTPKKTLVVVDALDNTSLTPVSAIAGDGRIRNNALTIWTDISKLGSGVTVDGRKTDLGGAGQHIPGYAFNGGGNPGRGPAGSARTVYYDSNGGSGKPDCSGLSRCTLDADDAGVRTELLAATGATAVTLPDPNAAANCQAARTARDDACNATGAFTSVCAAENAACTAGCNGGDYTAVCNAEQATCNSGCTASCTASFPGTLNTTARNLCISTTCPTACATTRLTCPAGKIAQCNLGCPIALAACPLTKQTQCLADSAAQYSSCLIAGTATRSADTLVRELLLYARGFEVGTRTSPKGTGPASSPTNSGVVGRPWLMGAVLHSKPLAINYGKRNGTTDDVRVVFGSADGMMHMVNDATGTENWGFMPQAVMGSLATLRENASGAALPYGVDGAPVVLIRDRAPTTGPLANRVTGIIGDVVSDSTVNPPVVGDRVLLFFGLRRGGAAYYALDITNPDNPRLQWRLSAEGLRRGGATSVEAGTAAQFAALTLAFSTPQVGRLRIDADGDPATTNDIAPRSVLIFGAGYHGGRNGAGARQGKDLNNSRATTPVSQVGQDDFSGSTQTGNAVFMVDVETGALVWRAVRGTTAGYTASSLSYAHPLLDDSIASDLTVLDTDNDGFTDRVYVGDTGGRLWRGDFAGTLASAWTFGPIASIGRHNTKGSSGTGDAKNVTDDRRLFFAPDYVPLRGIAGSGRDVVLFGSGDREDPLNLLAQNWFYGFIDPDLVSGKTASEVITLEANLPQHLAFKDTTSEPLTNLNGLTPGYRLQFKRKGEKMFSTPVTVGGAVNFSTYTPPDPSDPNTPICIPSEGLGSAYQIGVQTTALHGTTTGKDRDTPLAKTGLPGEFTPLSGTSMGIGAEVVTPNAKQSYRASWRERLGETQK